MSRAFYPRRLCQLDGRNCESSAHLASLLSILGEGRRLKPFFGVKQENNLRDMLVPYRQPCWKGEAPTLVSILLFSLWLLSSLLVTLLRRHSASCRKGEKFASNVNSIMARVIRRSFLEEVSERLPVSTTTLVVIVVGAVSLYIFYRRKGPTQRPAASARRPLSAPRDAGETCDAMTRIKQKAFVGKKICIAWEVLHDGKGWKAQGKALEILQFYALSSEVYLMCRIRDADDKKRILNLVKGVYKIERHRVLFCTTEKGYEAFTRQIDPSLMVTSNVAQVAFLKRFIQTIVLVGSDGVVASNVACVPSVEAIAVDLK
ncbi:hypothetical protein, conserved [Leishmania tarentolae]|uniref:Peroxisome assembly protein 22 n=1 Tax=Leishmania tarentolae TaxID=5689 RepID=A0A640KUX0_LEITA|nr:hypothetical protein, conserved [Leishmania tarentolae]